MTRGDPTGHDPTGAKASGFKPSGQAHSHGADRAPSDLSAVQSILSSRIEEVQADSGYAADAEPWQITYLDTITLLLILFILLSAMRPLVTMPVEGDDTRPDPRVPVDLRPPMMEPSPQSIVPTPHPSTATQSDRLAPHDAPADSIDGSDPVEMPEPAVDDAIEETHAETTQWAHDFQETMASLIEDKGLDDTVDVNIEAAAVSILLSDRLMFPSGEAGLTADGNAVMADVAPLLTSIDGMVSVEGHTDPVPIETDRFPSNWDLSTARAVSVLRALIEDGVPADMLRAVGHADTKPIADNSTAEGRARNRRVAIVVTVDSQP